MQPSALRCWAAVKAQAASDGPVDGKRAVCKGLMRFQFECAVTMPLRWFTKSVKDPSFLFPPSFLVVPRMVLAGSGM